MQIFDLKKKKTFIFFERNHDLTISKYSKHCNLNILEIVLAAADICSSYILFILSLYTVQTYACKHNIKRDIHLMNCLFVNG